MFRNIRCVNCGHKHSADYRFCPQCAAPCDLTLPLAYCGNCGSRQSPGHKFCPNCGSPFSVTGGILEKTTQLIEGSTQAEPFTALLPQSQLKTREAPRELDLRDHRLAAPPSKLTPKEIREYLDNLPPLLKKDVASRYDGIKVFWIATLSDVWEEGEGNAVIQGSHKENASLFFCQNIKIEQYPELRIMPKGREFRVEGEISISSSGVIRLINCKLYF